MPACGEVASISGESPSDFFDYQDEFQHIQELQNRYVIKAINPSPLPIQMPSNVPDLVCEAVKISAGLVWSSAEAAGNQIRQAVELLMDELGIASSDAKGDRLSLHKRIKIFEATDKENGEVLLATKWLGNSGSHPGGLHRDDVLDAFDMLEYVLENLFGNTKKELLAKVAAINAKKGPVIKGP